MVYGCMVYTERAETVAVSGGTSHASAVRFRFRFFIHQVLQQGKYTTSVDIQKRATKSYSLM